jgi:bifunctional UDP-N-acetylglucosamine pyrophosphorylase/glucosamine-1-phosphate N-acetyltransferase
MTLAAVILAAGQGTRLKTSRPKVLHRLGGRPLIEYAVAAAQALAAEPPVLVVGHSADEVRAALGERVRYVTQEQQLGTGHAMMQTEAALRGQSDLVLVTYGDMPLIRAETLRKLVEAQIGNPGPLTMLTVISPRPSDFGRIVRDANGKVTAIVEAAQAAPEQLRLTELNPGAYCFNADWLWRTLPKLNVSPKGEYYLTDMVGLAVAEGGHVAAVTIEDETETLGINTRAQLAQAEAALRQRLNEQWMAAGVTLQDPASIYIEPGVQIGRDTVILANTHLQGNTLVGENCVIGPNTIVRDTTMGDGCHVECSVLEGAWLAEEVEIGPFAHLRSGARLERGVHMGNFGEVKNSTLGPGVKMGHFSYIGDAVIGAEANIGAGAITCNYDGVKKSQTVIGANAFIGSDTMLVAPVTLGAGARTGAGSVVTKDIPPHSLAVGLPARVIRRLNEEERKKE